MLIFTTRFSKKKAVLIVVALGLAMAALIFLIGRKPAEDPAPPQLVTNEDSMSAGRHSALARSSCGRFSPNTRCPASYASRIRSAGCVFDTATSVTPSGSERRTSDNL